MPVQPASRILQDITVLDLTRVRSGPTCVRQFADWGANVIKIEEPSDDPSGASTPFGKRDTPDFQNLHRNKRSLTLNLKSEGGVDVFRQLVKQADVVVENYRPGVKHRLGIDYETLKKDNPRIIYASISGFGQDGPYAGRPGFDQIAQGMGGLMSITGEPGRGPMRVGIPIADLTAGLFAAQGVLLALYDRERTGQGQWIQTSLLQAQIAMLDFQAARWLIDGDVPKQAGNNHPTSIPTGVFTTQNGHINIACAGQAIWNRFKDVLKDPRMDEARFADNEQRSANRDVLNAIIDENMVQQNTETWITQLNEAGVPCGEINNIDQVFASPQVEHLGQAKAMHSEIRGDTHVVGQPIIMSDAKSEISRPTPNLGQHTDEVLSELGLSSSAIEELRKQGAI